LYRTGAIDGMVYTQRKASLEPQSGLRLFVQRQGSEEEPQLIRSLSDGGFYAFGLIPGDYTLLADSGQLAFMRMVQQPDTLKFSIKSLAQGDWIDGLELTLVPKDQLPDESPWKTEADWKALLAGQLGDAVKLFTEAQELVYGGSIKEAEERINQSLALYETTYGLALKGTVAYLLGRKEEAQIYWNKARALNPEIDIPDLKVLDRITNPLTFTN
jgi:tetratricopeptide (TPR) repeat protein